MKLNNSIPYHPASQKKNKKAGVPECHLKISTSKRKEKEKKKCNLVLEILTSITQKNTTLLRKKIWMELLNKKYNDNFRVLFCCHMVSFMLEK
jgi:hypothetical protein